MRRRSTIPLLIALAVVVALGVAFFLRAKAPPEAARLLPESDAIVYIHLKTLRSVTHFDETPITRSPDFQQFIDATGIVPERDLDAAAFGLHRMSDPRGPNGAVAYSEVFVGRFDTEKLQAYLRHIARSTETYSGRTVYSIPVEGRTLRVAQLAFDTVAASNMPTPEQIHSMLDRSRASALGTPGSSLLAARYSKVPLLAQAWGIGHIGLPFAQNGRIALFGLELPLPADTDLVASLRFTPSVHLRIEEMAPTDEDARKTADAMNTLLSIARGLAAGSDQATPSAVALRNILENATAEQHDSHAILNASATLDQVRALATASNPAGQQPTAAPAAPPANTPAPPTR